MKASLRTADTITAVIICNIIAALAGSIIGFPTSPLSWLNSFLFVMLAFAFFGMLPMLLAVAAVQYLGRRWHVAVSERALWSPGLLYVPLVVFAGYIMSSAYKMADHQESGSEFIPLIIIFGGVYVFWVIPLISLVINTIILIRKMHAVQQIPPNPADAEPPSTLDSRVPKL